MNLALLPMLAALLGQSPAAPGDTRPNILVVIADDWSWPHAQPYGDDSVRTPAFNRFAGQGILFNQAYCASPSCTPSRAAMLTGRMPHALGPGANLWGVLPAQYATYPDLLAWSGYAVGQSGKGWGPGTLDGSGRTHNPAGPGFASFEAFLKTVPEGRPFCFWHGSQDPHRPYEKGSGRKAGLDPALVQVPPFLPDTEAVRDDLLDYLFEVQRFDATLGAILKTLDESGRADNTMVVVTSDNGMPFPRAKANLYDAGTRVPLAVRWPKRLLRRRTIAVPVSLADLAATFLDVAEVKPDPGLHGQSLMGVMTHGGAPGWRESIVLERERHADVRAGGVGYPARALRTKTYLYIRNFYPDRWPAGDPTPQRSVGPYGDIDPSPTKDLVMAALKAGRPGDATARLALARRPTEELYEIRRDPMQVKNLTGDVTRRDTLTTLRGELDLQLRSTADPRATADGGAAFDDYPYVGPGLNPRDRPAAAAAAPVADNTLTSLEQKLGWRLLFDGKTTKGWTADSRQSPRTTVTDGTLDPHGAGGSMLVHDEPAADFVLSLDFQITPGCNSGVFVRVAPLQPRPGKDLGSNGIEVAIDDAASAGDHDTGAFYDLVKPARNAMKPAGQWNHLVVVCDGPSLSVELNSQLVNRLNLDDWTTPNKRPDGTEHKFDVAYRDHPRKGSIGLQDHGKSCKFKNIKLMPIR